MTKAEKIRKLINMHRSESMEEVFLEMILRVLRGDPRVTEAVIERARQKFSAANIMEHIIPLYSVRLSEEVLDDILAFYETPAGKTWALASPVIANECVLMGQRIGRDIEREVSGEVFQ